MAVENAVVDQGKLEDKGTLKEQPEVGKEPVKGKVEDVNIRIGEEDVPLSQVQSWKTDSENKTKWQKELTEKGQKFSEDIKGYDLETLKAIHKFANDPGNEKQRDLLYALEKKDAKAIRAAYKAIDEALPDEDEFEDPKLAKLRDRLEKAEQRLEKTERGATERSTASLEKEIKIEMKEVKAKYPELDEEDTKIIYRMAETSEDPMQHLLAFADKYVERLKKRDIKTVKAYLEAKDEDKKKFVEVKGTATPPPAKNLKLHDGSAKKAFVSRLKDMNKD